MQKVVHFIDATRLNECFLFACQPCDAGGEWSGLLLYFRFESLNSVGSRVPCVKEFGEYPTEQDLIDAVEEWVCRGLFETLTKSELCVPV